MTGKATVTSEADAKARKTGDDEPGGAAAETVGGYSGDAAGDRAGDPAGANASGNAARVREFHEAIGEATPRAPTYPGRNLLALRRKLIEEEHAEVLEALDRLGGAGPGDLEVRFAETAHELADLLYVTYGALVWFGVDADAVFAEVHGANMRKTSGPKRADGKQLKPPDWRPADVGAVIERARRAAAGAGSGDDPGEVSG